MSENATLPEIRWLETRISRWDDLVEFGSHHGMRVTPETAMKTGVYFACARIVAETVASCPLHLYRRLSDDASERAVDIPLYRVLARRQTAQLMADTLRVGRADVPASRVLRRGLQPQGARRPRQRD